MIPLLSNKNGSEDRAKLWQGSVEHILPPMYYWNPMFEEGSPAFAYSGRDTFEEMQGAGFKGVGSEIYATAAAAAAAFDYLEGGSKYLDL